MQDSSCAARLPMSWGGRGWNSSWGSGSGSGHWQRDDDGGQGHKRSADGHWQRDDDGGQGDENAEHNNRRSRLQKVREAARKPLLAKIKVVRAELEGQKKRSEELLQQNGLLPVLQAGFERELRAKRGAR